VRWPAAGTIAVTSLFLACQVSTYFAIQETKSVAAQVPANIPSEEYRDHRTLLVGTVVPWVLPPNVTKRIRPWSVPHLSNLLHNQGVEHFPLPFNIVSRKLGFASLFRIL
jgi:hypothetical protein